MADIAINPVSRRVQYTGNTGLGPFAFTFNILADADIAVYKNTTLLTLTSEYTVATNADGTGSITLTGSGNGTALVASDVLTLIGARQLERTTDFVAGGDFFAASINEQLDSQVIMAQQLDEKLTRAIKVNPGDEFSDLELPLKADRIGKTLQFNATTGDPEAGPSIADVANAQTYATNAETSATNAATSASSASSSASAASSSATNAASSATAAAASETAAAASESAAATSETNAANSATSASTSASNSATSATAAATSATNAATSATAAASSATSASSAQTAAESARDATLAAYDNFDDRYLGAKASDPTVDNDGDALVAGALYFNTTDELMKLYTGSAWVAAYVSGAGFLALSGGTMTGDITFNSTQLFDGRDLSTDGSKLDGIEASADVTDTANVTAAGALMDSELTSEASVKALDQGVATTDSPSFAGLTVDTNTLYVDSTNNRVGVGTTSPDVALHVNTASAVIRLEDSDASGVYSSIQSTTSGSLSLSADAGNTGASTNMIFNVDGSEAMRLDSSGRMLVGTTTITPSSSNVNGFAVSDSQVAASRSGTPVDLNRKDSDGDWIILRRDGSKKGAVGTQQGRVTMYDNNAGFFLDGGSSPSIWPWKASATASGQTDAEVSLGEAANRFKDLYLSGSISDGTNSATVADIVSGGGGAGSIVAFVNFNGGGTVSIRNSGNVSSITDHGVGEYTVNFTSALSTADYSWSYGVSDGGSASNPRTMNPTDTATKSTSAFRTAWQDQANNTNDPTYGCVNFIT